MGMVVAWWSWGGMKGRVTAAASASAVTRQRQEPRDGHGDRDGRAVEEAPATTPPRREVGCVRAGGADRKARGRRTPPQPPPTPTILHGRPGRYRPSRRWGRSRHGSRGNKQTPRACLRAGTRRGGRGRRDAPARGCRGRWAAQRRQQHHKFGVMKKGWVTASWWGAKGGASLDGREYGLRCRGRRSGWGWRDSVGPPRAGASLRAWCPLPRQFDGVGGMEAGLESH